MREKNKEAIKIAKQIIEDIQKTPYNISTLRSFYRLVDMLGMDYEVKWVLNELQGYKPGKIPDYRYITQGNMGFFVTTSYRELNDCRLANKNLEYRNITPYEYMPVLQIVDDEIYIKTSRILSKLEFEKIESDIFEDTRNLVNKKLNTICPTAFIKLTEIYADAIESKSDLDIKQVALGCRSILNDFADAVYQPSNKKVKSEDGKMHSLTEDKYLNRLIAFIQENTNSETNQDFMKSHLEYLFSFLENVNKLANKGTHKGIPKEQANRCVIYTYLALGDIINICNI